MRNLLRFTRHSSPRRCLTAILLFAVAAFSAVNSATALQDERPTSLEIIPQSAAFYFASMNHEAQLDAFFNSNAYAQLLDTEIGKRMRRAYRSGRRNGWRQFGWSNPFADYLEGYSQSVGSVPGKMALTYIKQIFGNEIFIYGDRDWIDMSKSLSAFYQQAGSQLENIELDELDEEQIKALLAIGKEHFAGANTPTLVLGTVLDEPAAVQSLLQIAEAGIDQLMDRMPEQLEYITEGFEVIEEDGMYLLSVQLNSEMMPWDQVESDPDLGPFVDDIKAILSDKTFNLTCGVKDKFLIISVGPSNEHLRNLGDGDLLIDHPKLAPLKRAAAEHAMTSVMYTSEESARHSHESLPGLIDTVVNIAKMVINMSGEEQLRGLADDLESDAEELKTDLMAVVPEPGAYVGFSYLFEHGYEGFVYNWAENRYLDSSAPLTIVDYAGSNPAMLVAARDSGSREQFGMVRKWAGKGFDYVVKYVPRTAPDRDSALLVIQVCTELRTILGKLADSTEENLLEATNNSQTAFVLDFDTRRNSWHEMMPPSEDALPIPSMAILIEHHDKDRILAFGDSFFETATEVLDLIRDIPDSNVPDEFQIPEPQHRLTGGGDLFYYSLPIQAGIDETIAPHALVTDEVLLLGYSMDQTERLMSDQKPGFEGLLANRSRPMMALSWYDNRQVFDALHAWARYGVAVARESGEDITVGADAENDMLTFEEPQLMEALDRVVALFKCFESCSSYSYEEDGAQVTHYQMRFRDVSPR